ncbi:hypothetical protein FB451DRAFT_1385959 [Mycena latifolia]|nr:hypothetical protein FB451DRAFT_1385959 [Mycena latifolia]
MGDAERGIPITEPVNQDDLEASCAKIWSVYISEAEQYDKALVESWRGDMDGMLIFAGLFSASLTAFIVESYKTLTPDSGDTTAALLVQISSQLAASASGTTFEVPTPRAFAVPTTSVVCNILWFISLGLSLSCALIATLVEQWARDFVQKADMRPTPVIRARIFSYLYYGLKRFNMHVLVDLVPLLLHMSLVLFFAGLVAFLLPINRAVMAVAAALLGIVLAVYCVLTLLPLVYFDCPYRTPFSTVLWRVSQLWRRISTLVATRLGRPQERVGNTADETMVEVMISRATEPSAERDQRDQRALCWTMKSLVDDTELEPFIDGIPDVLRGPSGRKYKHDHLIRTLLDDPDVRLGDRLLELMHHSDSGLLAPDIEFCHKVSCLKALWTICTLSDKSAPLNLPLHSLARQLEHWHWNQPRNQNDRKALFRDLEKHTCPARAVLAWSILCSFDTFMQRLIFDLQKCEADMTTGSMISFDAVRTELNQVLEASLDFSLVSWMDSGSIISEEDVRQLSASIPSTSDDAPAWLQKALFFLDRSEDYWNDARHTLLSGFLHECLRQSNMPVNLYEFHNTLELLQFRLASPSALGMERYNYQYNALLHRIDILDDPDEENPWNRPNTDVLVVAMSIFFPTQSSSRPSIHFRSTNLLISYFAAHLSHTSLLFSVLSACNIPQLWAAIMDYLSSGCPESNTSEATLQVMCGLYHWLHGRYYLDDPGRPEQAESRLSWFNESTLSTLQTLPVSPPHYSFLAMVKTRILRTLRYRQAKLYLRLNKEEIKVYPVDLRRSHFEGQIPPRDVLYVPESFFATIPELPNANNEYGIPTQSDWDEAQSFLSHPLLSESTLGTVGEPDPNFDFKACDNNVEKNVHYLDLLPVVASRFCDARAVLYTDFLEACSSPTLPYEARDTLANHLAVPGVSILLAHPAHRNRFASGVQALMRARTMSTEHNDVWVHLIHDYSILGDALKSAEPNFRVICAQGGQYEQSAILAIKDALEEYAESVGASSEVVLLETVQERLDDLEALLSVLETPRSITATVPVEQ